MCVENFTARLVPTDGKADPRMKESHPWVGFAIRGVMKSGTQVRGGTIHANSGSRTLP